MVLRRCFSTPERGTGTSSPVRVYMDSAQTANSHTSPSSEVSMMDVIFTPKFQADFWMRVQRVVEKGCWEWRGKLSEGYGAVWIPGLGQKLAHRVAYTLLRGEIPEGLVIDHTCRNPKCVNPNHLEAVTFRENVIRGYLARADRPKTTHCKNGHELVGENVHMYGGRRRCRVCRNAYLKNRYELEQKGFNVKGRMKYRLTSPSGQVFEAGNLTAFCKEHEIGQTSISMVLCGKQPSHRGWRAEYIAIEEQGEP